jgi:hypothetical protein
LNLLLLLMMGAVLFSGAFASAQAVESLGESFGRVRIWSEVHGWLNFVVVVLVGLHLALNWDWMIAALRRHRPQRPALASGRSAAVREAPAAAQRLVCETAAPRDVARWVGRAVAVLLVASVGAGAAYYAEYCAMEATLPPEKRAALNRQRAAAAASGTATAPILRPPHNRPVSMRQAPNVAGTLLVTAFVAVIGRYALRLRL